MTSQNKFISVESNWKEWRDELNGVLHSYECPDQRVRELGHLWDNSHSALKEALKERSPQLYDLVIEWVGEDSCFDGVEI